MNPLIYEQIMSLLGLIALWAFWYNLQKPQRVDIFREKLFDLRGDLFDLAANGAIPFEHPAYRQLRLLINGLIRFAHRASFPTLVLAIAQSNHATSDPLAAWRKSAQELPEDVRNRLLALHGEVAKAFAKHLIGGSIVLTAYVALRVAYGLSRAFLLLLVGRRDLSIFTISHARGKVDWERSQVAKAGADVIEARVLREEEHRTDAERRQAYAH